RIGVSGLVQPDLAFHAVLGERFVPFRDLADGDVPVVQTVYREHGRVDLVHVVQIVPLVPELAVVTREPVLCRFQPLDDRTADLPVGAGVDVLGQYVGVLTLIPTGCHHRTVLAVVVVPARDRGDRDDGLQPLDTGGGDGVGQRAVVGHAHHGGAPCRPVGVDLGTVRVTCPRTPVQPVDDRLRPQRFVLPAGGGATRRLSRSE